MSESQTVKMFDVGFSAVHEFAREAQWHNHRMMAFYLDAVVAMAAAQRMLGRYMPDPEVERVIALLVESLRTGGICNAEDRRDVMMGRCEFASLVEKVKMMARPEYRADDTVSPVTTAVVK